LPLSIVINNKCVQKFKISVFNIFHNSTKFAGNWNTSKYKVTELFKASVVVMELGMLERATSIMGGVCIFDLGGVGLSHVWNITPAVAETVVDLLVVRALAALSPPSVTRQLLLILSLCIFLLPAPRGWGMRLYAYCQRPRKNFASKYSWRGAFSASESCFELWRI
jgi:hypothetical protein